MAYSSPTAMETLSAPGPPGTFPRSPLRTPPSPRRKRKGMEDDVEELGCYKRVHREPNDMNTVYPFLPPAEGTMAYPFPDHPRRSSEGLDPQLLQNELSRHLQQLLPSQPLGSISEEGRMGEGTYGFGDVQRELLACRNYDPMQVDDEMLSVPSPQMRRSASDSMSICMSPPMGRRPGLAPVSTPVPSPQRTLSTGSSYMMEGPEPLGRALTSSPGTPQRTLFSMGFRKDCEKCRQGVPGHYMHVMPH
ncbi:uncharacterized protein EV422DRAFT_521250 [Fimicolochytrium jonesii]|uniref:uncharacterized protein n=1 Tax=Fimicolochytrium jonesii TaxID=1396493 RepID=UPI0022FEFCF0|nr:uncharacterized protein EV422DRAFT_521250 [Fimicolochytrium jonesii]KAI8823506.1 hypothetical protein EV422DRAFT_521250 [Fimicolochytrium jonesii]